MLPDEVMVMILKLVDLFRLIPTSQSAFRGDRLDAVTASVFAPSRLVTFFAQGAVYYGAIPHVFPYMAAFLKQCSGMETITVHNLGIRNHRDAHLHYFS
ncbi:hypothetical protein BV898_11359 [Hypsibius exemplaris]|uniref:Uncharacterized protein n=1 Tax=Hypsibius exemplaris TaxID=2072580 RepID=A0A1W0WGQ3_HYPEX|nr:hypothetical protein BV898_11359 [Hypsibius exemplaris]